MSQKRRKNRQSKILREVIRMLQQRKGEWPSIAVDVDETYSWLTKLAQGEIPNPSVNKIEPLYLYLLRSRPTPRQSRSAVSATNA